MTRTTLKSALLRYGFALLLVAIMTAVRVELDPFIRPYAPYLLYVLAVAPAAEFGGLGPGLLATVLGVISGNLLFAEPWAAPSLDAASVLNAVLFLLVGAGASTLIHARHGAVARTQETVGQLRELIGQLALTEKQERQKLSQAMHDDLQQLLVAARFKIKTLNSQPDPLGEPARELDQLMVDAIRFTRTMTAALRPPVENGLCRAMQWLAEQMKERYALNINLCLDPSADTIKDERTCLLVFEAVRELLFNVVKHAQTDQAELALHVADHALQIHVRDFGVGYDPARVKEQAERGARHFGLFSVCERLRILGGKVQTISAPGQGTCVRLSLPLNVTESGPACAASAATASGRHWFGLPARA